MGTLTATAALLLACGCNATGLPLGELAEINAPNESDEPGILPGDEFEVRFTDGRAREQLDRPVIRQMIPFPYLFPPLSY